MQILRAPMSPLRCVVVTTLLLALGSVPVVSAQNKQPTAKEQLEFGVEMAKRGLWSEALFRFNRAKLLAPENPSVYNNLAVAHEALGLFEDALALYRQGLELSPQDKGLRNNYARFIDFYKRFKPEDDEDGAAVEGKTQESSATAEPAASEPITPGVSASTKTRAVSDAHLVPGADS